MRCLHTILDFVRVLLKSRISPDVVVKSLLQTWDNSLHGSGRVGSRSYTTLSRLADTNTARRHMGQVEFSDSQRSMQ